MAFDSLPFLAFLPIVVVAYWLLPQRFRWVLLLTSQLRVLRYLGTFVYDLDCIVHADCLCFSPFVEGHIRSKQAQSPASIWRCEQCGFALCLKVPGRLAQKPCSTLFGFFGLTYQVTVPNLLLPVGISFYTLQAISYLIDVYRGKIEAETHLGLFALYMAFFPKLVAGPIERAEHLIPQFRQTHSLDATRLFNGLRLVLWGMFKKIVVADRLAVYVNEVYGNPGGYTGWTILIAILFCTAYIYIDFSGYSDIAVGVARLFGLELIPELPATLPCIVNLGILAALAHLVLQLAARLRIHPVRR